MTDTDFNPRRVSPSRVGTLANCGKAFEFKYIQRLPSGQVGSAALFGTVLHDAREHWCVQRDLHLPSLVRQAWRDATKEAPSIYAFICAYQPLQQQADDLIAEIQSARPDIKKPRSTKDWKESEVKRRIDEMIADWLPRLNDGPWRFNESDPLPALVSESIVVAERYQTKWRRQPPAIHSELGFEVEFSGFTLIGRIDEVGQLLDPDTGERLAYTVEDAKTYRAEPDHPAKDSRQLAMYDVAVRSLVRNGSLALDLDTYPLVPVVDYMRLCKKFRYPSITPLDTLRLKNELEAYERQVLAHAYVPAAKSCRASFCDYKDVCESYYGNQSMPEEIAA